MKRGERLVTGAASPRRLDVGVELVLWQEWAADGRARFAASPPVVTHSVPSGMTEQWSGVVDRAVTQLAH